MTNPNDPRYNPFLLNALEQQSKNQEEFHQSLTVLDELSERNLRIIMRMLFKYPAAATPMLQFIHTFAVEGYRLRFEAVDEDSTVVTKPLRNSESNPVMNKAEAIELMEVYLDEWRPVQTVAEIRGYNSAKQRAIVAIRKIYGEEVD